MEGNRYFLIRCFSISFGILATPSHTLISFVHKRGGRREMKWPAFEAPYFLFSSLSVIQFSYLYGSRDVHDSINRPAVGRRQQHRNCRNPYKWSRRNNFISPQLLVYMFSGIWTSDSHKYTKNVCMTGHNIKYHQNKRNKMEELEGLLSPFHTR